MNLCVNQLLIFFLLPLKGSSSPDTMGRLMKKLNSDHTKRSNIGHTNLTLERAWYLCGNSTSYTLQIQPIQSFDTYIHNAFHNG